MEETAIKIEHVFKEYRLGTIGGGTLRGDLQSWWARKHGREDPNSLVGTKQEVIHGDRFLALDDINLLVRKGEAVGIIGHNGAGKSTLLKLLSRITAPSAGKISLNGRIASMLEVGTGFHPELSGRENVYMNGAILGMTRTEIDKKFDEIVEFSEVAKFIDTPVKRYSSGMYVKLAFSVASHLDSEIMIMDEVLAVGDMAFQQKCLNKMSQAAAVEGKTVLYVSHNMNTIRQLCKRCIVLDHGKLLFDGDVDQAINIYMNSSDVDCSTNVDLRERERPQNSFNLVHMERFLFCDRENTVYINGEPLVFKLEWTSRENLSSVRFRMIIRYQDDSPVGLVTSPEITDAECGKRYETIMRFDTSMLSEGRYYLSIAMYQSDKNGTHTILDHVTRACSFEVINNLQEDGLLDWQHRWWGSVKFPQLKVEDSHERDSADPY